MLIWSYSSCDSLAMLVAFAAHHIFLKFVKVWNFLDNSCMFRLLMWPELQLFSKAYKASHRLTPIQRPLWILGLLLMLLSVREAQNCDIISALYIFHFARQILVAFILATDRYFCGFWLISCLTSKNVISHQNHTELKFKQEICLELNFLQICDMYLFVCASQSTFWGTILFSHSGLKRCYIKYISK